MKHPVLLLNVPIMLVIIYILFVGQKWRLFLLTIVLPGTYIVSAHSSCSTHANVRCIIKIETKSVTCNAKRNLQAHHIPECEHKIE